MTPTNWRMLGCKKVGEKWVFDPELAESDKEAVKAVHAGQIAKYGEGLVGDFPDLLKKPVVMALVAERDGRIVDAAYMEASVELCMVGCDARAAASLRRFAYGLITVLKKRGFRMCRAFIPRSVERPVGEELGRVGFKKQDKDYAHFLLDLR